GGTPRRPRARRRRAGARVRGGALQRPRARDLGGGQAVTRATADDGRPTSVDRGPTADFGPRPRVALVHDWLTGMRGGEKVLEAIAELYPDATIHTLLHVKGSVSAALERHPERRSFVQWLPSSPRHYRQYLPV